MVGFFPGVSLLTLPNKTSRRHTELFIKNVPNVHHGDEWGTYYVRLEILRKSFTAFLGTELPKVTTVFLKVFL
jgi:hypothetical protein